MRRFTVLSIFCLTLMFGFASAQAAIIVTEGKVATTGKTTLKEKKTVRIRRIVMGAETPGSVPAGNTEDEDSGLTDNEGLDDNDDGDELSDMDNPSPEGWKCKDVGGGVEYCEEEESDDTDTGTGAGPGSAGGGGLGDDTVVTTEDEIAGCSGSGGSPTGFPLILACLLLLFARVPRKRFVL